MIIGFLRFLRENPLIALMFALGIIAAISLALGIIAAISLVTT